jgi:YfiH family protein
MPIDSNAMIEYRDLSAARGQQTCPLPLDDRPGYRGRFWAAISLRRAGDMKLAGGEMSPQRAHLLESLGIDGGQLFSCRQVHSRRVMAVTRRDPACYAGEAADGLLSDLEEIVLAVTVADCLPLFISDRRSGAFAVLHSGWKGTGIVREALDRLRQDYGSRNSDLRAVIGPGIGSCCYRVDADRFTRFRAEFGAGSVRRSGPDHYLDLRAANLALLQAAGVEDVLVIRDCTACNPLLSSYRRDGPGHFTHMLAMIGKKAHTENRSNP